MSSGPREQIADVYHLTSRGVDGRPIYIDDHHRFIFFRILARAVAKRGVSLHAYCLMSNHFHLVVETLADDELAPFMQYLNSTYARIFNEIEDRRGYLFENPYKSVRVESERHALEVCRYVVLNPIRAYICDSPQDYRWSSYRATLGLVSRPPFLTTRWVLENLHPNLDRARVEYALFVEEGARETIAKRELRAA
jgi:putative transposase